MKDRRTYYYLMLAALFAVYVGVQSLYPEPIQWKENYSRYSKQPFGGYISYELLPALFPDGEVQETQSSMYDLFYGEEEIDFDALVVINDAFEPDDYEIEAMNEFVNEGNHIFIAARKFSKDFEEDLEFRARTFRWNFAKDSGAAHLVNPAVSETEFEWGDIPALRDYISEFDSSYSTVLGYNPDKRVNFLKIPYGDGAYFICTTPLMFTNYHLTDSTNYQFSQWTLSYLPSGARIAWDEYYKIENLEAIAAGERSGGRLGFVLNQIALRWAIYLAAIAALLYVASEFKRKQRLVPIVPPKPNTTLEFTETIGRLYFDKKNHKNLAEKKIKVFLEYIRSHYFLDTQHLDEDFLKALTQKTAMEKGRLKALIHLISRARNSTNFSESDLIELNAEIERFHQRVHGKKS